MTYSDFKKELKCYDIMNIIDHWNILTDCAKVLDESDPACIWFEKGSRYENEFHYHLDCILQKFSNIKPIKCHSLNALLEFGIERNWNEYVLEYLGNEISEMINDEKNRLTGDTQPDFSCKYNEDKVKNIADRLKKASLIDDKRNFILLLSGQSTPLIFWNAKIRGAKPALFDLMQRITGQSFAASRLKKYFQSDETIHDKWRNTTGTPSKLIDEILQGI